MWQGVSLPTGAGKPTQSNICSKGGRHSFRRQPTYLRRLHCGLLCSPCSTASNDKTFVITARGCRQISGLDRLCSLDRLNFNALQPACFAPLTKAPGRAWHRTQSPASSSQARSAAGGDRRRQHQRKAVACLR